MGTPAFSPRAYHCLLESSKGIRPFEFSEKFFGYAAFGADASPTWLMTFLYNRLDLGAGKSMALYKTLHITIPEDLDYTGVFDEIFNKYTDECELVQVKTTNMGSLFRLTYHLKMKKGNEEKGLIDELRCRNGNLEITVSRQENVVGEL